VDNRAGYSVLWKLLHASCCNNRVQSLLTPTRVAGVKRLASVILCVSVCAHDKTKTAETKITKLGTGIVHHESSPTIIRSKGQRLRSQGDIVQKRDLMADVRRVMHSIEPSF